MTRAEQFKKIKELFTKAGFDENTAGRKARSWLNMRPEIRGEICAVTVNRGATDETA